MKKDTKSKKDKKAGVKKERTNSDLCCCYVIDDKAQDIADPKGSRDR